MLGDDCQLWLCWVIVSKSDFDGEAHDILVEVRSPGMISLTVVCKLSNVEACEGGC